MFWILALSIALLAALLIAFPLLRGKAENAAAQSNDTEVYRDQLSEIDRDAASGLIEGESATQAKAEIARRLIAASQRGEKAFGVGERGMTYALAAFLCLLLPFCGAMLYQRTGLPDVPDFPLQARFDDPHPDANILIRKAELKLETRPDDGRGWQVLAPIYLNSGRFNDAANAWRNAIKYLGPDPRRYGGLAEALVVVNQGRLDKETRDAFANVLKLVPGDPRARFYLAIADAQDGKADTAIAALEALKRDSAADAPWIGITDNQIARITAEKDQMAKAPGGPTQGDVEAAADLSDADRAQMIRTMVESLDSRLKDDPNNFEGWKRLIRSYVMLQDPARAAEALNRGLAAFPPDSDNGRALIAQAKEFGISREGITE